MNRKRKVLIIDDEMTNLIILEESLKAEYETYILTDAEASLSTVEEFEPDIILLDIMMPKLSGHEIIKKLKTNDKFSHIPVIFISALNDLHDETYGFKLGAVDYISKPIRPAIVRARVKTQLSLVRLDDLNQTRLQIIQSLGHAAEYKDNETGRHVIRMSHFSRILALALGASEELAENVFHAAPMHDIGKIGIPDNILKKPGKLEKDEWEVMKQHPAIGAKIIGKHHNSLLKLAGDIALNHHEKWDGSGYPNGLKGEQIVREARIVAIADVFDALTTERPYKKAWEVKDACEYLINETGKHFDPEMVPVFLNQLPEILKIKEQWKEI